jgi:hypothetical protein
MPDDKKKKGHRGNGNSKRDEMVRFQQPPDGFVFTTTTVGCKFNFNNANRYYRACIYLEAACSTEVSQPVSGADPSGSHIVDHFTWLNGYPVAGNTYWMRVGIYPTIDCKPADEISADRIHFVYQPPHTDAGKQLAATIAHLQALYLELESPPKSEEE